MEEQKGSKRESESNVLLQKLIRLDSKDCNFHFKDSFTKLYFKVAYQQTNIENHSNDALLRQFWHHVYAHYFKKIEDEEMRRMNYLQSLLQTASGSLSHDGLHVSPFLSSHPQFSQSLHSIFSPNYFQEVLQACKVDRETELWLQSLYIFEKSEEMAEGMSKQRKKRAKVVYSKLKQNRNERLRGKTAKAKQQLYRRHSRETQQAILELEFEEQENMTEIQREIWKLQMEAGQVQQELGTYVQDLQQKIDEENQTVENRAFSRNIIYASGNHKDFGKDLECLQYLIDCLQQKQIAESVSKIISTERCGGELMFKIDYQKAMNIEPRLITEKQLSRINFLRQTSLINFYRTGVKSLYSFICHNYVGFREMITNRCNITPRLKDKDLIQMMKKGAHITAVADIQQEMGKFNTCHHCKFLFQDHMLFTCRFTSDKQAIPKMNIEASCDPNLAQDFQEGPHRNRTSQRFMTRKKNCLTSYAKIHDQYVCGRKYCFSCLKDSYSNENIKENGLCPFCLGVCICTRCLRNEKIAKFKTMYSMLGGDPNHLQLKSNIEQLQVKTDEQIPRGRGRPKKYMITHIAINPTKKKLRRFGDGQGGKQNLCLNLGLQLSKKGKRKTVAANWKKYDSGNETQQQNLGSKKIKRGVGRPRLDKKKMIQSH